MQRNDLQKTEQCYYEHFSMQSGVVIPVRFSAQEQLFDVHDCYGVTIAPRLAQYLDTCLVNIAPRRAITLVLYGPLLLPLQKDAVKNLLKTYYGLRLAQSTRAFMLAAGKAAAMLLVAGAFFAAFFMLQNAALGIPVALCAVLCAAWAVRVFTAEVLSLGKSKRLLQRMYESKIDFRQELAQAQRT